MRHGIGRLEEEGRKEIERRLKGWNVRDNLGGFEEGTHHTLGSTPHTFYTLVSHITHTTVRLDTVIQ